MYIIYRYFRINVSLEYGLESFVMAEELSTLNEMFHKMTVRYSFKYINYEK